MVVFVCLWLSLVVSLVVVVSSLSVYGGLCFGASLVLVAFSWPLLAFLWWRVFFYAGGLSFASGPKKNQLI